MLTPLQKLLRRLAEESDDFAVIVEGKRDAKSLKNLGIERIVQLNSYRGYEELAEGLNRIGVKRVVILTDFDRKGEEIRKGLLPHLNSWGISEESAPRYRLRRLTGVIEIEELYDRVSEILGGDIYGQDICGLGEICHKGEAGSQGHSG